MGVPDAVAGTEDEELSFLTGEAQGGWGKPSGGTHPGTAVPRLRVPNALLPLGGSRSVQLVSSARCVGAGAEIAARRRKQMQPLPRDVCEHVDANSGRFAKLRDAAGARF